MKQIISKFEHLIVPSFIIGVVFSIYIFFHIQTQHNLLFEELQEFVTAPYMLKYGLLLTKSNTNLAWYSLVHLLHSLFGFSLQTSNIARLVLQFFTLFSIWQLLEVYKSRSIRMIVFLTVSLSPALIYFTSNATAMGLDLQLIPIILYLLSRIRSSNKSILYLYSAWLLFAFGLWSYPIFFYYLPYLVYVSYIVVKKHSLNMVLSISGTIASVIAFSFALIQQTTMKELLYSGMFRGGGNFPKTSLTNTAEITSIVDIMLNNMHGLFKDLFVEGLSYQYFMPHSDFTHIIPILSLLTAGVLILLFVKNKSNSRTGALLATLLIGTTIIGGSLVYDPGSPGLRRFTPALVGIYILYYYAWIQASTIQKIIPKKVTYGLLSLITIAHIVFIPANILFYTYEEEIFFNPFLIGDNPTEALSLYVALNEKQDIFLFCPKRTVCRYSHLYTAIRSSCEYNNLSCKDIYMYDHDIAKNRLFTQKDISIYYDIH